ncbi:MAG: transposase [Ignavibacteriales bacterium]|nr:transposase [Ignavibacteriales bacterium]
MDRKEGIEDNRFYHVYNRGNDRERIFGDESDYEAFLKKMDLLMVRYSVSVPIYCLMPNHYHMIAMQNPGGSLSTMMGALATSAAKRYNLKYGHIGHLFQGPFRFKFVLEDALWDVAGYIHLNPVKARLVSEPEDWKFSNFAQMKVTFIDDQSGKKVTFNEDALWKGYPAWLTKLLANERLEKAYWERVQTHVKGLLHP